MEAKSLKRIDIGRKKGQKLLFELLLKINHLRNEENSTPKSIILANKALCQAIYDATGISRVKKTKFQKFLSGLPFL